MKLSIPSNGWCQYREGVEIPGLATVRLPGVEAHRRISKGDKRTREARTLAAAAGMPTARFNRLSPVDKAKIRYAFNAMTAPTHCGIEPDPIDWEGFEEAWRVGNSLKIDRG